MDFFLFGMGPGRRKLLFEAPGTLRDALTGEIVRSWAVGAACIEPAAYRVTLDTPGGTTRLMEDEEGVWIETSGGREPLTLSAPVSLPTFDGHPQAERMRILHGELLVNLLPWGPVPNLWVYPRPWYRDAAMMLMCLQHTGNLSLVTAWLRGLHQPFDMNNGEAESDNLGQVLYLLSFVAGPDHPLAARVLREIPRFLQGTHLGGRTDCAAHPVYQTKWLKFGLRALGLDDPYEIPAVFDSYSALFWMDYRDAHVPGPGFDAYAIGLFPYLGWAEAHFHRASPPLPLTTTYPLTWEAEASQADYWRLPPILAGRRSAPHTWHAAEMFLYWWELAG